MQNDSYHAPPDDPLPTGRFVPPAGWTWPQELSRPRRFRDVIPNFHDAGLPDQPHPLHAYGPRGAAPLCGARKWQELVPNTEATCPVCVQMLTPKLPPPSQA